LNSHSFLWFHNHCICDILTIIMKFIIISLALMCMSQGESARILVVSPTGSKSHKNTFVALTKELVKRGHDITILGNYATSGFASSERIHEILLPELEIDVSKFPSQFKAAMGNFTFGDMKFLLHFALTGSLESTEKFFRNTRVQHLLANSQFDLVIGTFVSEFLSLPLAWNFKAPIIMTSPNVLFPGTASELGDSDHTEYVPFILSSYSDKMNLVERVYNTIFTTFFLKVGDIARWGMQDIIEKHIPNCPSIKELEDRIEVVFTNTHPSFTYPRVLPPSVIEVGAIQCAPANPLPLELEEFVSSSPDGFILFSIGSILPMNDMPEYLIKAFIKVFSALPQRVIWQWKGTPTHDLPSNIKTLGWLPQQDLLGHKNCRLFLSHGGLNSLQEAIYHSVPVLGLPFGTDQTLNLLRAAKDGYALKIDWKNVSEETLSESINELLHNSSYSDSSNKLSFILRDQTETPLERAVYWTEFVLRHNGASHLRLGSRSLLPYQRALVDVYAVLFSVAVLPLVLLYFCLRCCCSRKSGSVDLPKKNQ